MVEGSSTKNEIGVERERIDPMRMLAQRSNQFARLGIPNLDRPIGTAGIDQAFSAPLDHVDARRMSRQRKLGVISRRAPDLDSSILRRRRAPR